MKTTFLKLSSAAALMLASMLGNLSATPVLITTLDLNDFPSYGDGNVQIEINQAIAEWNTLYNPDLPTAGVGATPNFKLNTGGNQLSIDLTLGSYNYLFMHWGGPNEDLTYFNPQLYYIGGDSGLTTFNAPVNHIPGHWETKKVKGVDTQVWVEAQDKVYGLSFYSFYSPKEPPSVPDNGVSVILLGLGLVSLALFRRKAA